MQSLKNGQNFWVYGLCPWSGILNTRKHNVSVPETLCFLVFRIEDDGQSAETQYIIVTV
jgi:hypothetical protein